LLGSIVALAGCSSPLADSPEANRELSRLVQEYSAKGYRHWRQVLLDRRPDEHLDFTGPSGIQYQADIDPVWDDQPNGVIRVVVCIDDRGPSAYRPLCRSAVLNPVGLQP
jgi:hypothetical protein